MVHSIKFQQKHHFVAYMIWYNNYVIVKNGGGASEVTFNCITKLLIYINHAICGEGWIIKNFFWRFMNVNSSPSLILAYSGLFG